ncbi:response regulator transcription factor [Phytoactinopolyspora halotolerans]|uniref:Response regulator transcription factor n=1 Tax=Phytoactinopolyspora halotolerans TaxID=1981512 RepID=A0A6L9SEI9_9ACTN|nr:response regulator transcription factor [Phytoactinopolyspora halotolerans]NEE03543.1 response regulator transcription factor [Phytoactinopolyspora halotolerans]
MRVLVVDDEPALLESLARSLRFEGYQVITARDGTEALAKLADARPDALVLDLMLPRMNGLDVCRRIRMRGDRTPVLMLTARDAVRDRVRGLDVGADDYLVKPFAHEELLARLRAILRRVGGAEEDDAPLTVGDLRLDPRSWQATRGDRRLVLTRTEFGLLELLMRHPKQVLTRGQLYEGVWGADLAGSTNSLDVYIGYVRKKLEAGGEPRMLHTVRGVGYMLRAADTDEPEP